MKVAILGTGIVGQTVAAKLVSLGHTVAVGTRDVANTLSKQEKDIGNPPFKEWLQANSKVTLKTFAEAAASAEVIFNCTKGTNSIDVLHQSGEENLNGKLFIDISNPLVFAPNAYPTLSPVDTDSLGELIQRTFPKLKVVKTLNTMNCFLMMNPALVPGDHNVFVSGNDSEAKARAIDILKQIGWSDKAIIDLGDISTARGTEQLLPIWIRLYGKFKHAMFNFHIAMGA